MALVRRALVGVFVVLVVDVALTQAGIKDWYYRCCTKGKFKARGYNGDFSVCEKDDLEQRRFANLMDRMICRMAERVCCMTKLQQLACDKGQLAAFQGKQCSRPHDYSGSDRFVKCCDCCALGIKTSQEQNTPCDDIKIEKNPLCQAVYTSCCKGQNITIQPGVHYTLDPPVLPVTTPTAKVAKCLGYGCQHFCREDRRRIPVCYCRNGYLIDSDGKSCLDLDECVRDPNLCKSEAINKICLNTEGSYRCVASVQPPTRQPTIQCTDGYTYSPEGCKDIDECTSTPGLCGGSSKCENSIGSYLCIPCGGGYRLRNNNCEDIDECRERRYRCNSNERCQNTQGSYKCVNVLSCPSGYKAERGTCVDIDECRERRYRCNSNERCQNTQGSYKCVNVVSCTAGYKPERGTCVDVNECAENTHRCSSNQDCQNTRGSYRCVDKPSQACPAGYQRGGSGQCEDINECSGRNDCSSYAVCTNTQGSYVCRCINNFQGDGKSCVPVVNRNCPQGFRRQGGRCVDIDECAEGSHSCISTKSCQNTRGSYICVQRSCPSGYTRGRNGQCEDVNECLYVKCSNNEVCRNRPGTYVCEPQGNPSNPCSGRQCPRGYECKVVNNIVTCQDINECLNNPCKSGEKCVNQPGRFYCQCPTGYRKPFGVDRCEDINECVNHVCQHDCKNTPGSFQCSCREGYKLTTTSSGYSGLCVNIDECATQNPCVQGRCRDTIGSYQCFCDPGFRLDIDGKTCKEIDECSEGQGRYCAHSCQNTVGSYKCTCRSGWKLAVNQFQCIDQNECEEDRNICGSGRVCANRMGSYECLPFTCPPATAISPSYAKYYRWETQGHKCVKDKCPDGDSTCYDGINDKSFTLWIFNIPVGSRPEDIFTYRIILQGYRDGQQPVVKYRFRSGNEQGVFEIQGPNTINSKVFVRNKNVLSRAASYRLEFVGELFLPSGKLVSRYVHYLYIYVYNP